MEKENRQWPQFLAVSFATFLTIGVGIQMGWPSPSVPRLLSGDMGFNITEDQVSYVVMLCPLGYIIGSPLCGILLDTIGRKYTLLLLAPIQLITWISVAFSENVTTLCAARVLMGVSEGGMFTALPAYIGEVMEPKVRGMAGTSISLGILLGVFFINIYGSFVSIRVAAYISIATPILFFVTFAWVPESPYYFLAKGEDHKARKALKLLRGTTNVETELSHIKKAVQRQLSEPGRFRDIFTIHSNFTAFTILTVLRTVQQFSGMYVVGFYMQVIFRNAKAALSPEISAIICNGIRIILTLAGSFLIDRTGRKTMIYLSSISTALTLAAMGIYFHLQDVGYNMDPISWVPLVIFVLYYICSSVGLLVVPTIMMGELLPSNIKAKALTLLNVYFGICMSASTKLFQFTDSRYGPHVPFYIFTGFCIFGVIYTYLFVPETKGKSLEEIQLALKGSKTTKEAIILLEQKPEIKERNLEEIQLALKGTTNGRETVISIEQKC